MWNICFYDRGLARRRWLFGPAEKDTNSNVHGLVRLVQRTCRTGQKCWLCAQYTRKQAKTKTHSNTQTLCGTHYTYPGNTHILETQTHSQPTLGGTEYDAAKGFAFYAFHAFMLRCVDLLAIGSNCLCLDCCQNVSLHPCHITPKAHIMRSYTQLHAAHKIVKCLYLWTRPNHETAPTHLRTTRTHYLI